MDYRTLIIELLDKAKDKQIRVIYYFIKGMID